MIKLSLWSTQIEATFKKNVYLFSILMFLEIYLHLLVIKQPLRKVNYLITKVKN